MIGQNLLFAYMNMRTTLMEPSKCGFSDCTGTYEQTNNMHGEKLASNITNIYCCNKCNDYIKYDK